MAKKLDKSKLKSNNAKWNKRAEETFDKVISKKGLREKLSAALDELEADSRELVTTGTQEEQLEAIDVFRANREAWLDMVLDG